MSITAIIDKIGELVVEHGSSKVKGDHIALLQEQLSILKEQLSTLEADRVSCKSQLKTFSSENSDLRAELKRLNELINSSAKEQGIEIDKTEKKILKFLFDNNREFTTQQIAAHANLSESHAQYYLDSPSEKGFLGGSFNMMAPSTYSINHEGRAYIVSSSKAPN